MSNVWQKLRQVQDELKAPKNQRNTFGNYNYRSAEDIQEAAKPILKKVGAVCTLSDDMFVLGVHTPLLYTEEVYDSKQKKVVTVTRVTGSQRFYVKAIATFTDIESGESIIVTASANEEETKKGMDSSQITGSTSSYARKYALNGLYQLDDTKDSDSTNKHGKEDVEELPKLITQEQIKQFKEAYKGKEDKLATYLEKQGLNVLGEMLYEDAKQLLDLINSRKPKQEEPKQPSLDEI